MKTSVSSYNMYIPNSTTYHSNNLQSCKKFHSRLMKGFIEELMPVKSKLRDFKLSIENLI